MAKNRYYDWLRQAREDMLWARDTYERGFYPQACFTCQQAAEKAMKSMGLYLGYASIASHSISKIAGTLEVDLQVQKAGRELDQYYISGRYPDALPEGIASDYIMAEQAESALSAAEHIVSHVEKYVEQR